MNFISDEDYKRYQKENRLFEIYGKTETDPDIEISLNELLGGKIDLNFLMIITGFGIGLILSMGLYNMKNKEDK